MDLEQCYSCGQWKDWEEMKRCIPNSEFYLCLKCWSSHSDPELEELCREREYSE